MDAKILRGTKFPPEYSKKVDMQKVNLEVMKQWISGKVIDILGNEDDVVIDFVYSLLEEEKIPDPKKIQINLTGFLEKDTPAFCKQLWELLLSAQSNPQGVPMELLEKKKEELRREKAVVEERTEQQHRKREEEEAREREIANVRERERDTRRRAPQSTAGASSSKDTRERGGGGDSYTEGKDAPRISVVGGVVGEEVEIGSEAERQTHRSYNRYGRSRSRSRSRLRGGRVEHLARRPSLRYSSSPDTRRSRERQYHYRGRRSHTPDHSRGTRGGRRNHRDSRRWRSVSSRGSSSSRSSYASTESPSRSPPPKRGSRRARSVSRDRVDRREMQSSRGYAEETDSWRRRRRDSEELSGRDVRASKRRRSRSSDNDDSKNNKNRRGSPPRARDRQVKSSTATASSGTRVVEKGAGRDKEAGKDKELTLQQRENQLREQLLREKIKRSRQNSGSNGSGKGSLEGKDPTD
ncbi:hypothetical protein C7212DRAFT_349407 [Tuber magnatum]|uniref:PWI domain-containing protein n=1 Tax=Tuber magnatum TaxID=42249 RepID=A0A317T031_9PEZI|nr:hypothetical protein C7212DRAFT_349407 [Tuber magnatum]